MIHTFSLPAVLCFQLDLLIDAILIPGGCKTRGESFVQQVRHDRISSVLLPGQVADGLVTRMKIKYSNTRMTNAIKIFRGVNRLTFFLYATGEIILAKIMVFEK